MSILITGAAGFVGRAVVDQLLARSEKVIALDRDTSALSPADNLVLIEGELTDSACLDKCFEAKPEKVIHLAALPGGAAEADPVGSFNTNVAATVDLMHRTAGLGGVPRFVFSSTIAVFGDPLPEGGVDDNTPLKPKLFYGMHKQMAEIALGTLSRRGMIDGLGLRLPGIVARPSGASGMKSAFMSDIFHAIKSGAPYEIPVSERAQLWLMSVQQCAENLVKALSISADALPESRIMTLPAIRAGMKEMEMAIANHCGIAPNNISYKPDAQLEAAFGCHPALSAEAAEAAGLCADGDLSSLVNNVFENLG